MPEGLAAALALPGLPWLVFGTFLAGLVRGFSGFGTALIYIPIAAQLLPPLWVLITIMIFDLFGPLIMASKVRHEAHWPDLGRLYFGTLVGLPVGLGILLTISGEAFRYATSFVICVLLVCLIFGLRYRGTLRPGMVMGTGILAGTMAGAIGLPGPPVILFYLASPLAVAVARANMTLYLLGYDAVLFLTLAGLGHLEALPVWIGLLLVVPNVLGVQCGGALFRPEHERVYWGVAYAVIAGSAVSGLPVWDG